MRSVWISRIGIFLLSSVCSLIRSHQSTVHAAGPLTCSSMSGLIILISYMHSADFLYQSWELRCLLPVDRSSDPRCTEHIIHSTAVVETNLSMPIPFAVCAVRWPCRGTAAALLYSTSQFSFIPSFPHIRLSASSTLQAVVSDSLATNPQSCRRWMRTDGRHEHSFITSSSCCRLPDRSLPVRSRIP